MLDASLRVTRFTPAEVAALSDKVKGEYSKIKSNSASVIEDEIGAEALILFNYQKEDSLVSQYSTFLYNAENNRFTYVNKGTTKKAVKSSLGYEKVSDVGDRGKTYVVESGGSSSTPAHNAYKASKDNYINAAKNHQYITTSQINEMGSYVSSNYSGVSSVWDFLKARGFSLPTSGSNTDILITSFDTSEDTNKEKGKKNGE